MTIIAGYFDEETGKGAIGADSVVSLPSHKEVGVTKLVHKGNAIVGIAGSPLWARYVGTFRDYDAESEDSEVWVTEMSDHLIEIASELGHRAQTEDGMSAIMFSGLVLTPDGLYDIDAYSAVGKVPMGYTATGSGAAVGIGALCAALCFESDPDVIVSTAIEAAITHAHGCGGEAEVWIMGDDEDD